MPYGYTTDVDAYLQTSDRIVESVGLTEAEVAREIFIRLAKPTETLTSVVRWLNEAGVSPEARYTSGRVWKRSTDHWTTGRIQYMIGWPVYHGERTSDSRFGEITYTDQALALVSPEEHATTLAALDERRH
jgi:hypothetical protein